MTTEFLTLRSIHTGKTGDYPAHFADFDDFEIADSEDAWCVDCNIPEPPVDEKDEDAIVFDLDDEEIDTYDEEGEDRGL